MISQHLGLLVGSFWLLVGLTGKEEDDNNLQNPDYKA